MWLEYLRIATSVLRGHKFRSLLTVMSITIGAFSIVLMTSLAASGSKTLFAGLEEIGGARIIRVWPKQPDAKEGKKISYSGGITEHDADALRAIPHLDDLTVFSAFFHKGLQLDDGRQVSGDVEAADLHLLPFYGYHAAEGRLPDENDRRDHARVCVIGDEMADRLYGKGERVVGRTVLIQFLGMPCRIIGRLARVDRFGGGVPWEWDDVLVGLLASMEDFKKKDVDAGLRIALRSDHQQHNEIVKRIMNSTLVERHHGVDDFTFFDSGNIIEQFKQLFAIMSAIVGLLAGIALLVGGVGIMNIMLVSVSERVREIGIRKALGASPQDIGRQFLVEAMLLSTSGGVVGVVAGVLGTVAASLVIRHFKPHWQMVISEPAVVSALVVTLIIGVGFGYFPARRASKLDAVQAIRTGA